MNRDYQCDNSKRGNDHFGLLKLSHLYSAFETWNNILCGLYMLIGWDKSLTKIVCRGGSAHNKAIHLKTQILNIDLQHIM